MKQTIGFIGGGNMATSLIGGLIKQGDIEPGQISVFEPNTDKAQELVTEFAINVSTSNKELIETSDIIVIAVKPQILEQILSSESSSMLNKKPLLISIVAGITIASIEQWLGGEFAVVRVMPNTPALIGIGASGLFANSRVTSAQRNASTRLVNAVGMSAWVDNETDIDSITALSGSGPAYFMLFIQGLIEAAEASGLSHETAKALAVQTATGAAQLVASSELSIQTLIENVTSPNGTTEKALQSLNQNELKSIAQQAFEAARKRSLELAAELA